jgi:nicotinamide-nucleotide amidase
MKATIITIGDEILIGQIIDTNSAWLGQQLSLLGVSVHQIVSISDNEEDIKTSLKNQLVDSDLLIFTGGLGPTKDDITKKSIADYFNSDMVFDENTFLRIKKYFDTRGIPVLEAHKEQCYMPVMAEILDNDLGTAPGMLFHIDNKMVLSVPGVPYEMKWIFTNKFLPLLKGKMSSDNHIYHTTIKTIGRGETTIAEKIEDIVNRLPSHTSIAYLPSVGSVRLRLSSIANYDTSSEVDEYASQIKDRLGHLVYGMNEDSIEAVVLQLYREKKLTLGTAESCTGGLVAHKLTSIPGSSEVYQGSIVSYSYPLKEKLLHVSHDTLTKEGAVSEKTVIEMLKGLLSTTNVDVGIAISGIAGPGGGTPEKPVGTIWLAWGSKDNIKTKLLNVSKNRKLNIEFTSVAALNALRLYALEHC